MGNFQLGPKRLIVNDPSQVPFLFFAVLAGGKKNLVEADDDFGLADVNLTTSPDTQTAEGADIAIGDADAQIAAKDVVDEEAVAKADMLRILGFGDFQANDPISGDKIIKASGAKGVPAQKQAGTITFGGSAIANHVGKTLNILLKVESINLEGQFSSHLSDYRETKYIGIDIEAGETASTLASKLVSQIEQEHEQGFDTLVTATVAGAVVTLTAKTATLTFKAAFEGTQGAELTAVYAETVPQYEGRNTHEQLKTVRLQTPSTVCPYPEEFVSEQIPLKGALYSSYKIVKEVNRPDLQGSTVSGGSGTRGQYEFEIFLNESTCSREITNLTKWLNANVANRTMYAATTAAGVLAPEVPVVEVATDDAAPYATGLS